MGNQRIIIPLAVTLLLLVGCAENTSTCVPKTKNGTVIDIETINSEWIITFDDYTKIIIWRLDVKETGIQVHCTKICDSSYNTFWRCEET